MEFGVVFLIVTAMVLILTVGLGDDASRNGGRRISPWSVFNQVCNVVCVCVYVCM